ncbi:putative endonuclease [Chitinophaga niastensis]|uniref:Putative endonuclease n=1 Tax=Chitinophaga niastensis TaxID=536980 RepID=A0A2P8HB45_CHINA|nr:YraN family protein [Chitinophaga niastensis]PSL43437.1 putative endonuclease [Chitinophaga niastensis]
MLNHLSLGRRGEIIAQDYVSKHCTLLHINWKSGRKEIDIIAEKKGTLYFIEVKTRSNNRYGWPEEAVNYKKQEHIQEVATDYLEHYNLHPIAIRFDIIAITFMGEKYELMHLRDVF